MRSISNHRPLLFVHAALAGALFATPVLAQPSGYSITEVEMDGVQSPREQATGPAPIMAGPGDGAGATSKPDGYYNIPLEDIKVRSTNNQTSGGDSNRTANPNQPDGFLMGDGSVHFIKNSGTTGPQQFDKSSPKLQEIRGGDGGTQRTGGPNQDGAERVNSIDWSQHKPGGGATGKSITSRTANPNQPDGFSYSKIEYAKAPQDGAPGNIAGPIVLGAAGTGQAQNAPANPGNNQSFTGDILDGTNIRNTPDGDAQAGQAAGFSAADGRSMSLERNAGGAGSSKPQPQYVPDVDADQSGLAVKRSETVNNNESIAGALGEGASDVNARSSKPHRNRNGVRGKRQHKP